MTQIIPFWSIWSSDKYTDLDFAAKEPNRYGMCMSKIKEFRKKIGMSQAQLAELLGTSQPQIRRLEAGDRKLTKEWAERLAGPLETTAAELLFDTDQIELNGLEVVGVVQAGQFVDITLQDQDTERERIMVAKDARFSHARQYALKVAGDSMNLKFPDGCYVTCVELVSSGLELKAGMTVHVERSLGGSQHVETTLKEIQSINGETVLVPRSTNPKHQPIVIDGDESTEIKICGVVTGKWEPQLF